MNQTIIPFVVDEEVAVVAVVDVVVEAAILIYNVRCVQRLVIALLDAGTDMIHNIKLRTMPTMVFTLLLVRPTIPMVTPLPLAMVILLLDLILAFLLLKMYG
jgi:hypothetical protein